MIFHGYITSYNMSRIFLLVIVIESQDFLRCIPPAALKLLWRYLVLPGHDSRPFSLENCLKEKLTDSLVTAAHAENRSIIPFPLSGCIVLCRPIQEAWEWLPRP
jgi:hypothetical protein